MLPSPALLRCCAHLLHGPAAQHRGQVPPASCRNAPGPHAPSSATPRPLQSELEAEVTDLRGLPRTREVRQRLAAVQSELRQYRPPGSWWRWW